MSLLTALIALVPAITASKPDKKIDMSENDRLDLAAIIVDLKLELAQARDEGDALKRSVAALADQNIKLKSDLAAAREITNLARSVAADVAMERDAWNRAYQEAARQRDYAFAETRRAREAPPEPPRMAITTEAMNRLMRTPPGAVLEVAPWEITSIDVIGQARYATFEAFCTCVPARQDVLAPLRGR